MSCQPACPGKGTIASVSGSAMTFPADSAAVSLSVRALQASLIVSLLRCTYYPVDFSPDEFQVFSVSCIM